MPPPVPPPMPLLLAANPPTSLLLAARSDAPPPPPSLGIVLKGTELEQAAAVAVRQVSDTVVLPPAKKAGMYGVKRPFPVEHADAPQPAKAGRSFRGAALNDEFWSQPTPAPPLFRRGPKGAPPSGAQSRQ